MIIQDDNYTTSSEWDIPTDEPKEEILNGNRLVKFPDGSAYFGKEVRDIREYSIDPNHHTQNLAIALPDDVVKRIGFTLRDAIQEDKESQSAFYQAVADAIRLLGLNLTDEEGDDNLPFDGASTVFSTALFESTLDLLSSIISALLKPSGVADCVINGNSSEELVDRSYRKKLFFNNYLKNIAKEFTKESRRTWMWAILCGSCYKKVYIDPSLGRPTSRFIRPEDFIVNREFSTHLTASRKTHVIHMTARDLALSKMSGVYRDITVTEDDGTNDDDNEIQSQLNDISGVYDQGTDYTLDKRYVLYECHVDMYIEQDPSAPSFEVDMPYIITLDSKTGDVLSIRRNWEKSDILKKKKEYFVNYSLLPSLDDEGYGLVHYAGRLAEAATCVTRQIINTATYANFPGGIYSAGIRIENNNLRPAPGEFVPIQTGGLNIDQIIKPLPYKEPSPALRELLVGIEDSIKRPSAIINQKVSEMAPTAPGITVLAMLESLQKVQNVIVQGFHESFGNELMLFNDRFADWLPDDKPYPFSVPGGEHIIMKQDFMDDVVVIPVSDPSLQNSNYRFVQSEIILNQAKSAPELHNMKYAYSHFYKNMGCSPQEINNMLVNDTNEQPFTGDPITEDQYLLTGKPIRASIEQDHDAHILVHQLVVNNPQASDQAKAAASAHIQEHEALKLLVEMQSQIGFQMPDDPSQIPAEMQNQIAVAAAQIAQQKLAQMQAQTQPPQQMDPGVVMDEDSKRKAEVAREKINVDVMKLELEKMKLIQESELQKMELEVKDKNELIKADLENKKIEISRLLDEKDQLLKEVQYLNSTFGNINQDQIS